MTTDGKLNKLFDEWSHLSDLVLDACTFDDSISNDDLIELCDKRDKAWERYKAAAQLAQDHERQHKHDESMRGVGECENVDE